MCMPAVKVLHLLLLSWLLPSPLPSAARTMCALLSSPQSVPLHFSHCALLATGQMNQGSHVIGIQQLQLPVRTFWVTEKKVWKTFPKSKRQVLKTVSTIALCVTPSVGQP